MTESELLTLAAALESHSEHPLATAVMERAKEESIAPRRSRISPRFPGNGLRCTLNGAELIGGSLAYISGLVTVPDGLKIQATELSGARPHTAAVRAGR